ncbi:MAG: hypothetical protein A3F11_06475 [Gammaproteobacteria bacterium RIFCSPHIGHO2_12_FULL_37_14]|nr:MAG: hypothetical protein A3F11_06475 [Gammaproteobacteria bacterium RIFCSPHIGHO2_12_FULL_37_14]
MFANYTNSDDLYLQKLTAACNVLVNGKNSETTGNNKSTQLIIDKLTVSDAAGFCAFLRKTKKHGLGLISQKNAHYILMIDENNKFRTRFNLDTNKRNDALKFVTATNLTPGTIYIVGPALDELLKKIKFDCPIMLSPDNSIPDLENECAEKEMMKASLKSEQAMLQKNINQLFNRKLGDLNSEIVQVRIKKETLTRRLLATDKPTEFSKTINLVSDPEITSKEKEFFVLSSKISNLEQELASNKKIYQNLLKKQISFFKAREPLLTAKNKKYSKKLNKINRFGI